MPSITVVCNDKKFLLKEYFGQLGKQGMGSISQFVSRSIHDRSTTQKERPKEKERPKRHVQEKSYVKNGVIVKEDEGRFAIG